LTDGREYTIVSASLVMGREAGCDVVVPGKDVSRRHAEIVASPKGYLLVDSSTNGVYVNEERVQSQRLLARADVIRIGEESFRFYADSAAAAAGPPAGPAPGAPAAAPAVAAAPPPAGAEARLQNTSFGMPATPRPTTPTAAPLANFLVRSGALKGTRLIVRTPVANIGRADYNDLVLPDESVSTSHAKLQRREGVWILVDLESTNGTHVDGERISTDTPIAPGTMVRFGDVQLVFEPTDDALGVAKGGGTKVIESFKPLAVPPATAPPAPPAAVTAPPAPKVQPPAKAPAAAPAPKPPASAPPKRPAPAPARSQQKKSKGCGASAAVFVLATSALVYWILV
jgi:pSer/pThr/pTyr-binding forkhead associated (FHA) protein